MEALAYLETVRKRLIIVAGVWLVAFVALYGFAERLFVWLAEPMQKILPTGRSMVFLSAIEPFFTLLELAAVAALVVSAPLILWQVWALLMFRLEAGKSRYGLFFVTVGSLFFAGGAYLGFRYIFPLIIAVLIHFGTDTGDISAMLSMGDYLSLAMKMMLAFGLVCDLPVLMIALARLGLVDGRWFSTQRKYMLIVAFVFGGVITPGPDVFSQCSVAVPFVVLYEVGIWGARLLGKKKVGGDMAEAEAGAQG